MSIVLKCGCNIIDENNMIPCFSDNCVYVKEEIIELLKKDKAISEEIKQFEREAMDAINPWRN